MENKLYRVLHVRKRDHGARNYPVTVFTVLASCKEVAIGLVADGHASAFTEVILASELDTPVAHSGHMTFTSTELEVFKNKYEN